MFNEDNSVYALISKDNVVQFYDTSNNEVISQFKDNQNIEYETTSLCFISTKDLENSSNKKRKRNVNDLALAIGNDQGKIKIIFTNQENDPITLNCLEEDEDFITVSKILVNEANHNELYCCSENSKNILKFDVSNQKLIKKYTLNDVNCCMAIEGDLLLAGKNKIELFKLLKNGKAKFINSLPGHDSNIVNLKFVGTDAENNLLIMSNGEDRYINLWKLSMDSKKVNSPVATLTMKSIPKTFAVLTINSTKLRRSGRKRKSSSVASSSQDSSNSMDLDDVSHKKLQIACTLQNGEGLIFEVNLENVTKEPIKPSVTISSKKSKELAVLNMVFNQDQKLLLVNGPDIMPLFKTIEFDLNEEVINLPNRDSSILLTQEAIQKQNLDTGYNKNAKTTGDEHLIVQDTTKSLNRITTAMDVDEEEEEEENQVSMGQKLAALNEKLLKKSELISKMPNEKPKTIYSKKSATSLSSLLEQSLKTDDNGKIEECILERDAKIIQATVQRLSPNFVVKLLDFLVKKLEFKPSRGVYLLRWIHSIFENHSSYLSTATNLDLILSSLYNLTNKRLENFDKLLQLSGKLDFILVQATQKNVNEDEDEKQIDKDEKQIYDENKSSILAKIVGNNNKDNSDSENDDEEESESEEEDEDSSDSE